MLTGLNHITLASRDLEKSLAFYVSLLEFKLHAKWVGGAYLSLGDLWFCLSCDASMPAQDYTHIAFSLEPEQFPLFCERLRANNIVEWKANKSEGDSMYILDPDGHKLEVHVGSLQTRLAALDASVYKNLQIFD